MGRHSDFGPAPGPSTNTGPASGGPDAADLLDADALIRLRHLVRNRATQGATTALPGGFVTRQRGRGLETADLRAYYPGDDPRHIDRNATARSGVPHVRNFHAERDRVVILAADFRSSMLWGTSRTLRSVAAAEALCLAGWDTVAEGGRVGLIALAGTRPVMIRPRGRDRGMISVIGGLVRAHRRAVASLAASPVPEPAQPPRRRALVRLFGYGGAEEADALPEPPLSELLEMAGRLAPRGAQIVLATAFEDPGADFTETADAIRRRADLRVIRVSDPFERDPPRGLYRFRLPGGRSGRAELRAGRASGGDADGNGSRSLEPARHGREAAHRMKATELGFAAIPDWLDVSSYDTGLPPEEQLGFSDHLRANPARTG